MFNPSHRDRLRRVMKRLDSPFYFYDLDFLKAHLASITSLLDPSSVRLWYACKANPLSAILKVLRNASFGMDVASAGELRQVLGVGVEPSHIIATGPAKTEGYIGHLLENGIRTIVLESPSQALGLEAAARSRRIRPRALLRLQLDWPEGDPLLGGGRISAFGVEPEVWRNFDFSLTPNIDIVGYHCFQWGNVVDVHRLEKLWYAVGEAVVDLSKAIGIAPRVVDLGGGIGIDYTAAATTVDFGGIAALLGRFKNSFRFDTVWMELGRYLVGECGHYFVRIVDKKTVRGKDLLILEGGINHMARPALTGESFPARPFEDGGAEPREFRIHGPLCTALDALGSFMLPEDIRPGDWLVFSQAGAYGHTESLPFFLCHDLPAEVVFYGGDMMVPRGPKTGADWLV